jgi:agmatinase
MKTSVKTLAAFAAVAAAHGDHHQKSIEGPHQGIWYNTLPGDGGTQVQITLMSHISFH